MTVDPPDYDPELKGHTAVAIEGECHATTADFVDGEPKDVTECGLVVDEHLDDFDVTTRGRLVEEGAEMCRECWPEEVV